MLNLDQQNAREIRTRPVAVELVRVLLLNAVVAMQVEALVEIGSEIGIGRCCAPVAEVVWEMTVVDDQRITGIRMCVEAFRQQHMRTQIHVATPELAQSLTANLDVLYVLR